MTAGPENDHTYKNATGTYMYLETSVRTDKLSPAHLETAMYVSSADKCKLTFWYSMYGKEVGGMNVYLKNEQGHRLSIWSLSGNQGPDWKQVGVNAEFVKVAGIV